jgi:voltage-gated potassium channel Kch
MPLVSAKMDVARRITFGADILNVSGAAETPAIVRSIREKFPLIPILATIEAGANAITYTPPTNGELFAESMRKYRATYTD